MTKTRPSVIFGLYLLSYGIFRIIIEFFRGDFRGELIAGFTPTQWIALVGAGIGTYLLVKSKRYKIG